MSPSRCVCRYALTHTGQRNQGLGRVRVGREEGEIKRGGKGGGREGDGEIDMQREKDEKTGLCIEQQSGRHMGPALKDVKGRTSVWSGSTAPGVWRNQVNVGCPFIGAWDGEGGAS